MEDLLQSPSSTALLGVVVLLLVFGLFFSSSGSRRREPPGPWPLPLFGNLLQLNTKSLYSSLGELSKKYGPVFTVYMGPAKVVVVTGYKTIKKALVNHDVFGEKLPSTIIKDLKLDHGIVFANGQSWKEMRHFALTNLKDFGMGKKACEEKIIEETQHLIDLFKDKKGRAFDTTQPINYAISNIISSMLYGKRFEYDDPEFSSMVDRVSDNTKLLGSPAIQWLGARKQLMKSAFSNRSAISQLIKGLQETLNPHMCRGLVDSFLVRQMHQELSNPHYHMDNLLVTVINLFAAGTDTTASTIRFGLLLMAKHPEIQDQVQEELESVLGGRQVQVGDRKKLPYTDAVVHEIQRMATVTPMITHHTFQDVTFQDYFIKKGTEVLFLLSSVLNDEDEWENPHTFNPAHFLDKEGNFRRRDAFLPFSAGVRACVGESLARMELFLFFASLLQRFRFTPPPGVTEEELNLTPVVGFTLSPKSHQLCAISQV
ncbi:cytochrome P450 2K1-like [Aulostomus maculatus]